VDYAGISPQWESYKKILSNLDFAMLFIASSKNLKALESLLVKDNVYQVPFSPRNTRHLKCSLRSIRNHVFQHRKYLLNLFDKSFDECLMNVILDNHEYEFGERISALLCLLSNSFDFEVAVLLSKKERQGLRVFKNKESLNFCPLLPSKGEVRNICEDFLSGNVADFPPEFLYNDFLRFNITKEIAGT
jgi:hypothetical protein